MLLHHSGLPAWRRSTSDDPYFGPYKILSVDGHRITVRCSPLLEGSLVCAAQHLKRYYDPENLCPTPPLSPELALPHPLYRVWSLRGHLGALLSVCSTWGTPKLSSG